MSKEADFEEALAEDIASFRSSPTGPLDFVLWAFPWGEDGALVDETGPDDWQREVLLDVGKQVAANDARVSRGDKPRPVRIAVASGHGVGKAMAKCLIVPTPDGERRWGDLVPGDRLFGLDGKPTRIVATHEQGVVGSYRVTFDDGSSTLVCGDHVWTVRGRSQRRNGSTSFVNMTTEELLAAGVTRKNGKAVARQWELPRHEPVSYPFKWVPVEPYTLGVWLGDGAREQSRITSADPEIPQAIRDAGYEVTDNGPCRVFDPTISSQGRRCGKANAYNIGRLRYALERLGVAECNAWDKFVPDIYKQNIPEIRLAVLQGLMDTDGEVTNGGGGLFGSSSWDLARDVAHLTRSLGGKAKLHRPVRTGYRDPYGEWAEGRPHFKVSVRLPGRMPLFRLARKQDRVVADAQPRYLSRWIESIEPAGGHECMCVTVDRDDGLYLANDFIATHNSALVSWLILYVFACWPYARGVVTANTASQLETKTWPELGKWHSMCLVKHWFEWTSRQFYSKLVPEEERKNWQCDAVTWSEGRTEGFAGLHNAGRAVLLIFDEASAIIRPIYEVASGALTDGYPFWFCFGNPTRAEGPFFDIWNDPGVSRLWNKRSVDSRDARMTNKEYLDELVAAYGEDSDYVRVRVKGQFPRSSVDAFISAELANDGLARTLEGRIDQGEPLIMGVDVARFGDDRSVLAFRQGQDARSIPWQVYRGLSTVQLADQVARAIDDYKPDAVFIDGLGIGGGVIDMLRRMQYRNIFEVGSGERADDADRYLNVRAELWDRGRLWLVRGGVLPVNVEGLFQELTSPHYMLTDKGQIKLERKKDMKTRGLPSPDGADALMFTFSRRIARRDMGAPRQQVAAGVDYDVLGLALNGKVRYIRSEIIIGEPECPPACQNRKSPLRRPFVPMKRPLNAMLPRGASADQGGTLQPSLLLDPGPEVANLAHLRQPPHACWGRN